MPARTTPLDVVLTGYVRVAWELRPAERFRRRLERRLRKLERGGKSLRDQVLDDLSRMVRRVG